MAKGVVEFKELQGAIVGELLAGGISGDVIIGAAAVYDTVDAGGDRIIPGAFMATLAEKRGKIPLKLQHTAEPVGRIVAHSDEPEALIIKGRFSKTTRARDAKTLFADNLIHGLSIGYVATGVRTGWEGGRKVRELTTIDLMEVSLVDSPMHPQAKLGSAGPVPIQRMRDLIVLAEAKGKQLGSAERRAVAEAKARISNTDLYHEFNKLETMIVAAGRTVDQELAELDAEALAIHKLRMRTDKSYARSQKALELEWLLSKAVQAHHPRDWVLGRLKNMQRQIEGVR